MKELPLLVWLTQFGLSVAAPLVGYPLLALWLSGRFGWGKWVVWVALALGVLSAIEGLRASLKTLERLSRTRKQEDMPPPVSFSEHD